MAEEQPFSTNELTNEELRALVARVKAGDDAAFAALRQQFLPLMIGTIDSFRRSTVLETAESEDLLQLATIALYRAAGSFDIGQEKVTFGLYAKICIRNCLTDVKRRMEAKARKQSAAAAARAPRANGGDSYNREDSGRVLALAKEHLSEFELQVLQLRISGLRYKEIAKKLGCSVKSADNAVTRARKKLRRLTGRQ